jgi:hypothetical protein
MNASLIVLVPVVLLGLVAALCFVGCGLHTHGLALLGPYQDGVRNDPDFVACWPLNDQSDLPVDNPAGTRAIDIGPNDFSPLNGWIQDVAVYNDALSVATITDHFNTGTGG